MPNVSPITALLTEHARETGRLFLKWRLSYRDNRPKREQDDRFKKAMRKADEAIDEYYARID